MYKETENFIDNIQNGNEKRAEDVPRLSIVTYTNIKFLRRLYVSSVHFHWKFVICIEHFMKDALHNCCSVFIAARPNSESGPKILYHPLSLDDIENTQYETPEYRASININTVTSFRFAITNAAATAAAVHGKSISHKSNNKRMVIFLNFMISQLVPTFIFCLKIRGFIRFFRHSGESSSIRLHTAYLLLFRWNSGCKREPKTNNARTLANKTFSAVAPPAFILVIVRFQNHVGKTIENIISMRCRFSADIPMGLNEKVSSMK